MYIGETHRTWGDRAREHLRAIETHNSTYATVRHHDETHLGSEPMFTFHQMGQYNTSLERQIRESWLIENYECTNILNGKGEWGTNLVPRARFTDENPNIRLNRNRTIQDSIEIGRQDASHLSSDASQDASHASHTNASDSNFDMQLSQRRKRRRILNEENRRQHQDVHQHMHETSSSVQYQPRVYAKGFRRLALNGIKKENRVPDRWKQTELNFAPRRSFSPDSQEAAARAGQKAQVSEK